MTAVFADTFFYVALLSRRDQAHEKPETGLNDTFEFSRRSSYSWKSRTFAARRATVGGLLALRAR
jgi:hypothetical protein